MPNEPSGTPLWDVLNVVFPRERRVRIELPTGPLEPEFEVHAQTQWPDNRPVYRDSAAALAAASADALIPVLRRTAENTRPDKDAVQVLREQTVRTEVADEAYNQVRIRHLREKDRIREEFRRFSTLPKIAAVFVTTDALLIDTRDLVVTAGNGSQWNIGPWRLVIPRSQKWEDLRCLSIRPRKRFARSSGWLHPHVDERGNICFGNAKEIIRAALRDAEYDVVAELLIAILDSGRNYRLNDRGDGYAQQLREIGDLL